MTNKLSGESETSYGQSRGSANPNFVDLELAKLNIVLVSHVIQHSESQISFGPPLALMKFLEKRARYLFVLLHPFVYGSYTRTSATIYKNGNFVRKQVYPDLKMFESLVFLKDAVLTFVFFLRKKIRCDIYIGADCLNALVGVFLRKLGLVNKVVYYGIDYTPYRFNNPLKNSLYQFVDTLSSRESDYVWSLTNRMAQVKCKKGTPKRASLVVPVGAYVKSVARDVESSKKSLVFMSHLVESKGIQLVLDALPQILEAVPDAELVIIGSGPYENKLREIIAKKGLKKNVRLIGEIRHEEILKILPKFGVGLAPYTTNINNITWFADPTKVKEYIACGLPVIVTNVPEFAEEIEKFGAGLVINYDKEALAEAVVELLSKPEFFLECKKAAFTLSSMYDWDDIYRSAFEKIFFP